MSAMGSIRFVEFEFVLSLVVSRLAYWVRLASGLSDPCLVATPLERLLIR